MSIKQGLETDPFSRCFEKIYRKNKYCRVAMTTTYENTSCNSENIVACLVSREGLLHACNSSAFMLHVTLQHFQIFYISKAKMISCAAFKTA